MHTYAIQIDIKTLLESRFPFQHQGISTETIPRIFNKFNSFPGSYMFAMIYQISSDIKILVKILQ